MEYLILFGGIGIGILIVVVIAYLLPYKSKPIPIDPELIKFWKKNIEQKEIELIHLENIAFALNQRR